MRSENAPLNWFSDPLARNSTVVPFVFTTVGVPEISPVAGFKERPAGRVPEEVKTTFPDVVTGPPVKAGVLVTAVPLVRVKVADG